MVKIVLFLLLVFLNYFFSRFNSVINLMGVGSRILIGVLFAVLANNVFPRIVPYKKKPSEVVRREIKKVKADLLLQVRNYPLVTCADSLYSSLQTRARTCRGKKGQQFLSLWTPIKYDLHIVAQTIYIDNIVHKLN